MIFDELKALYRAELVKFATRDERPGLLNDDIWTAIYDRDYNEPMFNSPVPEGLPELAALIADNPAIGERDVWDEGADTITVRKAMFDGVYQQLHADLSADWLAIKTAAQALR